MSKSIWKLWAVFCLVLVAGLMLTGCEEDDEDDDVDTSMVDTSSSTVNTTPTDNTVDTASATTAAVVPEGCDAATMMCVRTGVLLENETWTADYTWVLQGGVFVGNDSAETILTIEPGTTILGDSNSMGMLVVRRGSKIRANGTADAPIVFTSSKLPGQRARGDWGGLIINGRATINGCDEAPCEASGEGGTGTYGGSDDNDSSGSLTYVRVEFAGQLISPDNELNGIAFQAVGRGTVIDHIQVHMNADDGIEFFGGTANAKHVYLTGIGDDNLDWTDGWRGKAQFIVAEQYADAGDQGIEADNNGENNTLTPVANPIISNITLIGSNSENSDIGMLLREGTKATIHNALVANFGEACLDIDHDTVKHAANGEVKINNTIFACTTSFIEEGDEFANETDTEPFAAATTVFTNGTGNSTATAAAVLNGNLSIGTALTGGAAPADAFFDQVAYIGGVVETDNWLAGWTTNAPN